MLLSYVAQLKYKRVKIFTDSQGATRIVAIRSSKVHLQALAIDIFNLCLANSIVLEGNGFQGHLMREPIFPADLFTNMTATSILPYFKF